MKSRGQGLWITSDAARIVPTIAPMRRKHTDENFFIDANGCPTERVQMGGQMVEVHYDDLPDSDITTLRGLRVTTPLRTVIDMATQVDETQLTEMIRHCLDRGLFSVEEALARVAEPDMATRTGATLLRRTIMKRFR